MTRLLLFFSVLVIFCLISQVDARKRKVKTKTGTIIIKTANAMDAGTNGCVFMILKNKKGRTSKELSWPSNFGTRYSENSTASFESREVVRLGDIKSIEVWYNYELLKDQWRPEYISIVNHKKRKTYQFPINRWLDFDKHYNFGEYDTFLPKHDPFPDQRKEYLTDKRKKYEEAIQIKGVPPMCKVINDEENFDTNYTAVFVVQNVQAIAYFGLLQFSQNSWESEKDILNVYIGTFKSLPQYTKLKELDLHSDEWFARQRLQGINPGIIELMWELPEGFNVTDELVGNRLEGYTLQKAMAKNKLFMCNLKIMKDVREKMKVEIPAPIALFYLNKKRVLVPLAIQLFQEAAPDNPVFTPNDNKNTWQLAKHYYNLAESAHHQGAVHFAICHLLMEFVVISVSRHLSPSHPIYRLLKPHFIFTIAINHLALGKLISKGGLVDSTMTIGSDGMKYLASKGLQEYNMTRDSNMFVDFKDRGVTKKELKDYPYRDDMIKVYTIIRVYCKDIVKIYYKKDKDVREDQELQAWRLELSQETTIAKPWVPPTNDTELTPNTPEPIQLRNGEEQTNVSGFGIKGVPGDDVRGLETREQLIDLLAILINTASARHASVNFLQYDWYGYPPNYPAYLKGPIPTTKDPLTKKQVFEYLASRDRVGKTLLLTTMLSTITTRFLGDFREPMLYHPKAVKAQNKFRKNIQKVSKEIRKSNKKRVEPYPWCDPARIPNGVSV